MNISPISPFPIDSFSRKLIGRMIAYCNSETTKAISLLNHRIRKTVLAEIKALTIFPPDSYSSDLPSDILVNVISRYPYLKKLSFSYNFHPFTLKEKIYLEKLITYLQDNPLIYLKKLRFSEIDCSLKTITLEKVKTLGQLNTLFLDPLGNKNLKTLEISRSYQCSHRIVNLLTRSCKLKFLKLTGELRSGRRGDLITTILLQGTFAKLKYLELNDHERFTNGKFSIITKKLIHLKGLKINEIIDFPQECLYKTLEILGKNCPYLTILDFEGSHHLSSDQFKYLVSKLNHLKTLTVHVSNLSVDNFKELAIYCKNLKMLKLVGLDKLDKASLDILKDNYQDLKALDFSGHGNFSFEGLADLVQSQKKLTYLSLWIWIYQEDRASNFYKEYPYLARWPSNLTLSKMRKLVKNSS